MRRILHERFASWFPLIMATAKVQKLNIAMKEEEMPDLEKGENNMAIQEPEPQMYYEMDWSRVKMVPPLRYNRTTGQPTENYAVQYYKIWSQNYNDKLANLIQIGHPEGPNPIILFPVEPYVDSQTGKSSSTNRVNLMLGCLDNKMIRFAKDLDKQVWNMLKKHSQKHLLKSKQVSCLKSDGKHPPFLRCKINTEPNKLAVFLVNLEKKTFQNAKWTDLNKGDRVAVKLRCDTVYYSNDNGSFGPVLTAEQIYVLPELPNDVKVNSLQKEENKKKKTNKKVTVIEPAHASMIGL